MNKIQTVRDNLADHPLYKPKPTNIQKLDTFNKLSTEDVRKLINKMKMKSCELDVLPTHILKEMLDHLPSNHYKNYQYITYPRGFH